MTNYACCTRISREIVTRGSVSENGSLFSHSHEKQQASAVLATLIAQQKAQRRQVLAEVQKRRKIIYQRFLTRYSEYKNG